MKHQNPNRPNLPRRGGSPWCAALCAIALSLTGVLAGVVVGAPAPGTAASAVAEPLGADAVGLSPDVSTVRVGGTWSAGESEGEYRLIIVDRGFEHIVSKLYLQWLAPTPQSEVAQVRATAAFSAFNEMPVYKLDVTAWTPLHNGLRVELSAYNGHSGTTCRFIVEAMAPGVAKLTKRRQPGARRCD